ncbi:MAG: hypothetical protein LBH68_06990 [Bifidobacteriaceae bacterium]|nr:hypothetical protein [Bifidobacteriaceae bacterium]
MYAESYREVPGLGLPLRPPPGRVAFFDPYYVELATAADPRPLEAIANTDHLGFPIGVWPRTLEWALAAPPYFDSMILSSERDMVAGFAGSAVAAFPVKPSDPNPIEGD